MTADEIASSHGPRNDTRSMRKFWPYLFVILTILVFFRPFVLHGLLPIPSDTIVGLYHPFRDMYAKDYPRGVPFKNFLITDPVRQLIPWKSLAISVEKQFQLPLWNPYSFGGTPLLANFQTGAFYPLNILFFILPFSFAWSIFILLQSLLGGLFLYWYLRNLKLHPLAATIGSISFIFSGFAISWLEWGNVVGTLLWLPLILLSIDKSFFNNKKQNFQFSILNFSHKGTTFFKGSQSIFKNQFLIWTVIFLFGLCSSFFAGHLQLFFYSFLLISAYFVGRCLGLQKKWKSIFTCLFLVFCFLLLTCIQWIPTVQFILHSARNVDLNYLTTDGWFLPYQNLIQFLAPDFFGNPATLNYWGVWNYAEFVGYIGILPLIFAIFAAVFRHDKKTWFFVVVAVVALLFALPTPLGMLPFQLNIPLLSTSQPTRLMGIVDMSLAILVALGADSYIRKRQMSIFWICGGVSLIIVALWVVVLRIHLGISPENIAVAKRNLIFPSLFLLISFATVLFGIIFRYKNWLLLFGVICLLLVSGDLLRFGDKFTPFTPTNYLFPKEKTLNFLQENTGVSRIMTTDSRILAPNFSVMYKLQSLDGYDPLYLRNYAELIIASERGKSDIHTPFGFNRIITPHSYNSQIVDLLGVKYVLSLDDLHIQKLKKVYQEGETRVYENKNVLPRAFFVQDVLQANTKEDAMNKLFAIKDFKDTAIVFESTDLPHLSQGIVEITTYSPNKVILKTSNSGDGFLVLSDVFYPSWKASIDGKEAHILETDYALRGVFVPKGVHTIVFSAHLF